MLVPAMNHQEIAAQIKKEYEKICATTLLRLSAEYDRERRKRKVSKEAIYPKEYEIKTAGKNNWIIFLHKAPGEKKYAGPKSHCFKAVVYYYSNKGLMAFSPGAEDAALEGFTAHFFKRYNERLCLNLRNPIEIVKAFFRKGNYCTYEIVERNNRPHIIAFGADGIRFAKIMYNSTYVEWKTFVTRELAYRKQNEIERKLKVDLMRKMVESEKKETYNPELLRELKNTMSVFPMDSRKIA
jgi:hypothetical protein